MAFYVVTTAEHLNRWYGDSIFDHFCTEGVAQRQFDHYQQQGRDGVRLVHWIEGVPHLLSTANAEKPARHHFHLPSYASAAGLHLPR
jgi:hypothetical protein